VRSKQEDIKLGSRTKVDEEIAKNNQVEEAAEYMLFTNTCVKNKIPN
jgi:hypothetical protein